MESTEELLPGRPSEASVSRRGRAHKPRGWITGAVAIVVAAVVMFVGLSLYTDRPEFCATCHEMRPYVDAWAASSHSDVWCVDCHVGKSYPARFAHKFLAMGEVVTHFSGNVTFPRATPPSMADKTCSACHSNIKPKLTASGFNHSEHQSKATCQACHADTGHAVTQNALTAARVYKASVIRVVARAASANVGQGAANVPGHVRIACTRCHDLKKTGCPSCHTYSATHFKPVSGGLPACTTCHKAAETWEFTHPTKGECQNCHTPSATHFKPSGGDLTPCTQCHTQAGESWAFSHPTSSAECTNCHAVPAKHFKPTSGSLEPCSQCHGKPGVSWAFTHPGSSADCQSCHSAPAGHSAGQCSQCHHQTGKSFAFSHPSSGAPHGIGGKACVACHPNGYTTHSCTCH